ncbi:pentatricopeptide repeat-containing protein At3g62890-like [Rhododendron vialii]|uniref:pentatricopeptide repeat-containing protein At3g62890-like n=1 Tax=Rhododendron vialii TaxID=182163 RepID=UPI00265EC8F0|nr:pentatricopeptide repeat-containing protein At3g62890-like [Rhododendron vialii]
MARRVFDEMGFRDVATWTSLVTCYANGRLIESARHVFDRMPKRSVVSYSAMITAYVRRNRFKDGVLLFRDMLGSKMEPNDSTIMSVLCACANLGDLNLGKWVHSYISERKKNQFDGRIITALIDMYFKCGSIKKALKVFEGAKEKHVGEWTAMLSGLAMHGLGTELIEAFEEMISSGVKPNGVTFVALLSGCTHSGLVNEGKRYFDRMTIDFGIEPTVVHFGCVVDLLGRAGFIEQAVSFIRDMPVEANAAIWGALLTSCRVYKNVEVGELAARWLISAEPWNGALYMVLLGLYRDAGRWDDVEKVKEEMKKVDCRKNPGCSSIEVNGICREFVVGDKSHPLTFEACLTLANVIAEFDYRRLWTLFSNSSYCRLNLVARVTGTIDSHSDNFSDERSLEPKSCKPDSTTILHEIWETQMKLQLRDFIGQTENPTICSSWILSSKSLVISGRLGEVELFDGDPPVETLSRSPAFVFG